MHGLLILDLSLAIAHSDHLPPWPLSLYGEFSKSGPVQPNKSTRISLNMTFDIGLGEQHKLNCLQQRGTWKASWDGLGKYTEFYPVVGTIGSNTSKCSLCCQMKDILRLVGHFRLIVCNLQHILPVKWSQKNVSDSMHHIQSGPSSPADIFHQANNPVLSVFDFMLFRMSRN